MAVHRIVLNSSQLQAIEVRSTKGRFHNVKGLMRFLRGLLVGACNGTVVIDSDASKTAAVGTVTCASVQAADEVVIGDVTLAAHAATNTGLNFALGASDTACGDNLAAAINRHEVLSKYFLASNDAGEVTLTAIGKALGDIGNLIGLSSSNGTRLAVVALASGAEDEDAVTHTF